MLQKKWLSLLLMFAVIFTLPSIDTQASADIKAPVIEEIKVLTPNVAVGETMKVQIKVTDDSSGLDYVRILFFSPSQAHNIMPIKYAKTEATPTDTYVLESEVLTDQFEQGKWIIDLVQTKDNNGNIGNYNVNNTKMLKNVSFNFGKFVEEEKVKPTINKVTPKKNDDLFKLQGTRKNVAVNTEFTYTYGIDVAKTTFTKKNIYVENQDGENVPLLFVKEYDTKTKKSTVTIVPVEDYERNHTYTLYIKDIISKDNKVFNKNEKVVFTTRK